MSASAEYMDLPFEEAIRFFRDKVNIPTKRWNDLWQGMHARGFMVAGAAKDALLTDLHQSILKGIEGKATIRDFRKDFDEIVKKHGWKYKGGKAWRTGVIFNTNLRTAYAAGHHETMTDPDVLNARPYWRYVASSSKEPRDEHRKWYNLVLPHDDPFWKTHRPPNGWGCKCGLVNHSAREVERLKKEEADGPYPIKTVAPEIKTREWVDKTTGKKHQVPVGIDPGWDYNVGEAAWGLRLSKEVMDSWREQGAKAWERLTPGDWILEGRPKKIPIDEPKAAVGEKLASVAEVEKAIENILDGHEKVYSFKAKDFSYNVLVNAETLAGHLDLNRSPFIPFMREALEDPYEVWLAFERHKGTGKYVLRQRIIKAVKTEKGEGLLIVVQASKGTMEAWTFIPVSKLSYLNKQRVGKLIWKRQVGSQTP